MTAENAQPQNAGPKPTVALAKKPVSASTTIGQWIDVRRSDISKLLPKHLTVDRLAKTAAAAMMRTPKLQECSLESLFAAVMICAELGLEPTGAYGGVWLVPFNNKKTGKLEVQPIIDYRGLLDLARRSGAVTRIEARVVHENDSFRLEHRLDTLLKHTPTIRGEPGPMVGVYAVAELAGGSKQVEFMTVAEVERIRARSKASGDSFSPWQSDPEEMAKKTVLRRLCKLLPRSIEMRRAEEVEDEPSGPPIDVVSDATFEVVEQPQEATTRTAKLKAKVKAAAAPDAEPSATPPPISPEEQASIEQAERIGAETMERES